MDWNYLRILLFLSSLLAGFNSVEIDMDSRPERQPEQEGILYCLHSFYDKLGSGYVTRRLTQYESFRI